MSGAFDSQNRFARLLGLHPGKYFRLQLNELAAAGVQKRDVFAVVTSGSKAAIERPAIKDFSSTPRKATSPLCGRSIGWAGH